MRPVLVPALLFILAGPITSPASPSHAVGPSSGTTQDTVTCASAVECRRLSVAALERQEFEIAHTLAWRAMQAGPKNDPESMRVLARAQSLSGRPHDALIMLGRLTRAGVSVAEAATGDDYRRVRQLRGWSELLADIEGTPHVAAPPVSAPPVLAPLVTAPAVATLPSPPPPPPPPPAPVDEGLRMPSFVQSLVAIAYDGVSRRFVIADGSSDALKILDETSGNAMNLVSRGWAGGHSVTALAIDPRRGDLWAVTPDTLHRVQLVSGRPLQAMTAPTTEPRVQFVALKAGANAVFALDAAGARIYTTSAGDKALRLHATLDKINNPTSLAIADDGSIYVAHADGIVRLPSSTRKGAPLKAADGMALASLHSIEWIDGALVAVGDVGGTLTLLKLQLDTQRARVTAVTQVGAVHSAATTVSGRRFYHLVDKADGAVIIGRVISSLP